MTAGGAPPVPRNAPCPCGSGRRYRDCHGAISSPQAVSPPVPAYRPNGPDWDEVGPGDRARLARWMEEALARQLADDAPAAERLYRDVLAVAPRTHDALHMLAVLRWKHGDVEDAWRLIELAAALRDPYSALASNRDMFRRERERRLRDEPERRAEGRLPGLVERLASLAAEAGVREAQAVDPPLHLIVGTGDPRDDAAWLAGRLCDVLAPWRPTLWAADGTPYAAASRRARVLRPERGEHPTEGIHVHVGLDLVVEMDWIARTRPSRVAVVGLRARAVEWEAALAALARGGAVPVSPWFVTSAQAARFGRDGPVVPGVEYATVVPSPQRASRPWTLGVVAGTGRALASVPDAPLLRRVAASGIPVAIRDAGRLRFDLGDQPGVRFESRDARSLEAFVGSVDALLVPTRRWQDEGLGREIPLALAARIPVVVPRPSIHAARVRDGVDGRIVGDGDEAFDAIAALARGGAVPSPAGRDDAGERVAAARRILAAALALPGGDRIAASPAVPPAG